MLLCLALLSPATARGQSADVLSGLVAIDVRVRFEGVAPGYPGLDPLEVARGARERIQAAGLGVSDVLVGPDGGQMPVFELLLMMYADSGRTRRYSFSVTASLTEGVTLRRGGGRVWAQTWTGGTTVGIVGADGAALLRSDLEQLVEKFLDDYAKAGGGRKGQRASR